MKLHLFTFFFVCCSVFLFAQNKNNILVVPTLAGQDIVVCGSCTNTSAQIGNPANAYCSYQWFPSTGLSDPTSAMPEVCPTQTTIYQIIVTDEHGNAYQDFVKVVVAKFSNILYRPEILGSIPIDEDKVNNPGVMTFVNIDNDDNNVNVLERDDELIKWEINVNAAEAANVNIEKMGNGNAIKVWLSSNKTIGTEYLFNNTSGSIPKGPVLQLIDDDNDGMFSKTVWIEGIEAHGNNQKAQLRVTNPPSSGGQRCIEIISITVLGIENISWHGKGNGYDATQMNPEERFISNTLDIDPNYINPAYNLNIINGLTSYRVFSGKRLGDNIARNIVDIEVQFSTSPIEDFDLYLKSFDVDDPYTDPNISNRNPEFFIDPNDRSNVSGVYSGCNAIANYQKKGYASYDKDNDNRGVAESAKYGQVEISPSDPSSNKTGIFLQYRPNKKPLIISNKDDIAKFKVKAGDNSIKLGFLISRQPGDNYRITANPDEDFLLNLRNEDRFDGFKIVDANVAINNNLGEVKNPQNNTSDLLTIWRIIHVEKDAMADEFSFNTNSKAITISNFTSALNKATSAKTIQTLSNIQPADDLSDTPSRFQYGTIKIGQDINGLSTNDVTVCEKYDLNLSRTNGSTIDNVISTFNLTQGVNNNLLPVQLVVNGMIYNGKIGEITKNGSNFDYQILLNGGISLSNSFINGHIKIAGYQGNDVVINAVNTTTLTITSNRLRIPAFIADDDDNDMFGNVDFNISQMSTYFNRAFLELKLLPANMHHSDVPATINRTNDLTVFEPHMTSNDLENRDFWIVYICKGFQSTTMNDNDPNDEASALGSTQSFTNDTTIVKGGHISFIAIENIRDGLMIHPFFAPVTVNEMNPEIIITGTHEVGHQFGLGHGAIPNPAFKPNKPSGLNNPRYLAIIPEFGAQAMGIMSPTSNLILANSIFINRHCNFIRNRIGSPGEKFQE